MAGTGIVAVLRDGDAYEDHPQPDRLTGAFDLPPTPVCPALAADDLWPVWPSVQQGGITVHDGD